jgi:type I restriction enzyme M protein
MIIKKSQLYSTIWQACDELRGGMDASQYKDYVLVLLFVRYISDKYAGKKDALVVVPKGGSFNDLIKLKGKKDIGEKINQLLEEIAKENSSLSGVINGVDFDDEEKLGRGKEMVERLSNLIAIFENEELDFSKNQADGDDLLGDAYEYLMKNFAVESGKSKGQFYTPAEVSRIMAKVIGAREATGRNNTVYDPTCGSGSLLLKVAAEAQTEISIYGQEKETTTANLAILNMWLHGEPAADIRKGQSTMSNPLFINTDGSLKTFDYAVANPPFSYKAWRTGFTPEDDEFERFDGFGIPPNKNGDFAFLLHLLKSLKSTGKGAIILPHGTLFRGNSEAVIRQNIIKRGYIKGIIGLPANLFYGTGIPACIIVLDKENASERKGIFMIDASKEFIKDGNKNRLRERDIKKIVESFTNQLEMPKYSRFISNKEIKKNEYNLNIPRYINTQEQEDMQDIEAHLKGGIPNDDIDLFAKYWEVCPGLNKKLFKAGKRKGYSELVAPIEDVKKLILSDDEFVVFKKGVLDVFGKWRQATAKPLQDLNNKIHPKELIQDISSQLLCSCAGLKLVDKYDIYQHLMAYWFEVMQDDIYIIVTEGWGVGNQVVRKVTESKNGKNKGKKKEVAGLAGLEGKLIPVSLCIDTYFASEKKAIEELNVQLEQNLAQMVEMKEEKGGEGDGLFEVIENDKITKKNINIRIKELKGEEGGDDELKTLNDYLALLDKETEIKGKIKEAEADLEKKLINKYPKISEAEVKDLVIERKWMDTLQIAIEDEVDRLSQQLAGRIKELAERYAETLPEISSEVDRYTTKVDEHLKKMGFSLN